MLFASTLLLLLAILLSACHSSAPSASNYETLPRINPPLELPAALDSFPEVSRGAVADEEYQPVAESSALRLYMRQASSALIVEDLRSGAIWRSSPEDLAGNKGTTQAWRKLIELPVQVYFTDADRSLPKSAKPDQVKLEITPVQSGFKVKYIFETINLSFDAIYALRDDCLESTIVNDSIVEMPGNTLVSIDLLAFLGATHDGEEGYAVYPDGSGALMYFNTPHPPEAQKILSTIYGVRDTETGRSGVYKESLVMPVFGLVRGQSAFVGIITQGDFDADMGVARSGKGLNYNHVWASFIFRRQGRFSLTGGQPANLFEPNRIPGDRQVRFCFLNGKQADYVGMAARFRQYLFQERGAVKLAARDQAALPLMNLNFFMGIERRTWFIGDMILMTRFQDVSWIMKELASLGVKQADVNLLFWNEGSIKNKYPQHLPADERLGGEEGLRQLAGDLDQLGMRLFLYDNYLSVAPGSMKIQPYLDAIRGVDGLPVGNSDSGYLLNPQVSLRDFFLNDIPRIVPLGADGLVLESFAAVALPDKNALYPLGRENFAASWMQMAQVSRRELGFVAMNGSNVYAAPYADRLDVVTLDSTHYDLFNETVPFYHIAMHGLVSYTSQWYNLLSDGRRIFLRQVEYGALPNFVLTQESSARLFRTQANQLFSSRYGYWRDEVVRQYNEVAPLAFLQTQFITNHERLAEGVYCTTYESGARVIVNYNMEPYKGETFSVPAQDFIVVEGN